MIPATPPILITGCARSGTSLVAGIIDKCGTYGGRIAGPTQNNRRGFFENTDIRNRIIKPYLRSINCDPLGQFPLPDVKYLDPMPQLRDTVLKIFDGHGYKSGPWYYKGAKLCLLWALWHDAFPGAKWVIVRRKDEDIVKSCMQTGFMRAFDTEIGWYSWVMHHKACFKSMREHPDMDVVEIWPEHFVEGGKISELQALIESLGLTWDEDEVMKFISPALWSTWNKEHKHGACDTIRS